MLLSIVPIAIFYLFPSSANSSPVASRRVQPFLTVMTETDLTWCRPFADEMDNVVTYYFEPTAINVTCWADTTMFDDKGEVDGDPVWLKEDTGCWINEEYVQGENFDFQAQLAHCTAPAHQVGFPKDSYITSQGIACYASTNVSSATQFLGVGYVDLGCSTTGTAVNGNSTWIKWLNGNCYFPGDSLTPAEFHGYSIGKC